MTANSSAEQETSAAETLCDMADLYGLDLDLGGEAGEVRLVVETGHHAFRMEAARR